MKLQDIKSKFDVLGIIKLLQSHNISMDGGNCGTFALALAKLCGEPSIIYVISNSEDEEELLHGEPDIYHVIISINGVLYDSTGITDVDAAFSIAEQQYNNSNAYDISYDYPKESNRIEAIIRANTNWSISTDQYIKYINKQLSR